MIVECQPIYDVSGEGTRIKYYEVLVRLIDENGKIRYPGEFLDIAKKISLYNDITKKVVEHVFGPGRLWGPQVPGGGLARGEGVPARRQHGEQ